MNSLVRVAAAALFLFSPFALTLAQSLPIPHVGAEFDVPGAKEMPDPNLEYKVVFDIVAAAADVDDLNPGLVNAARFVNTLAKNGVPPENRQIAIVLHRAATEAALENDAHKARHDGHDNPNIALIQSLSEAGVDIRQCGQALIAREIDAHMLLPQVQLDYWALTTLLRMQFEGYVKVGP